MNPTKIQGELNDAKVAVESHLKGKYSHALIEQLFQGFAGAYVALKQFEEFTDISVKVIIE